MTVSTRNEAVEALAAKILAALGWRGFANIEFKRDPATGRYKFIELNPRVWQQIGQAESLGMNFPLRYYRDLTGGRSGPCPPCRVGVKWMDLKCDVATSLRMIGRGELSVAGWLGSLRRVRCLGLFALDDPLPFVGSIRPGAAVGKAWKLLRGPRGET
jgi:predicted ATP-grasp superfamily ATP-dependent carboligase